MNPRDGRATGVLAGEGWLDGFERFTFRDGDIEHEVLRSPGTGPVVLLLHEVPAVTARTLQLARAFVAAHFTVVVPIMLPPAVEKATAGQLLRSLQRLCVSREFAAFARHQSRPVVGWLRALGTSEADRVGVPDYGVVGMCFSGGFALATAAARNVAAAVLSQPAVPFAFPTYGTDLAISAADLDTVADRADEGFCVLGLRYQRDVKSPRSRLDLIREVVPNTLVVEIPTWNPNDHSVLSDAAAERDHPGLAEALRVTIDYLDRQLRPHATAD